MKNVVYRIRCTQTGEFYIGSTQNYALRKKQHKKTLSLGTHHNIKLQRMYKKYGISSLKFKILETADTRKEAYKLEDKYITKSLKKGNCINIGKSARGGDNLSLNPNRSKIIKKIKQTLNDNYSKMSSEERKSKFGQVGSKNGMFGRTHSEAARKIMSDVNKGNKYALGVKRSAETRQKMSEIAKTRTGDKNPFFGRHHSEETKKMLSEIHIGRIPTNAVKVKVGKKVYVSATEASRKLGCVTATILNRINSDKFPEYSYYSA